MKTQMQIFYEEQQKIGEINQAFLELVDMGLTYEDLSDNLRRNPGLWNRFEHWLNVLPTREEQANG